MEKVAEGVWLLSGFPANYFNVYLLGMCWSMQRLAGAHDALCGNCGTGFHAYSP